MNGKVWLIGGTSDSVAIAKMLADCQISFVVSVVTRTAKNLYAVDAQVEIGCMNQGKMQSFCQREQIEKVIDASHPYATEVSRLAIAIAKLLNIPYLRYERGNYRPASTPANPTIIELDSFDSLLAGDYLQGHRVFLTVGCKALPLFKLWHERSILYARVLPKTESLTVALNAGFTSDRLIAIRPPLSIELETALWRQWNISLVVTKASGKAGGEDIKRQVAAKLNIPLIIITRPKLTYPQQTTNIQEVLTFCQKQTVGT